MPIALSPATRDARCMTETLDAATVADDFCRLGIAPALTARLAAAVRDAGAAAVHALGAGVFDRQTGLAVAALIEDAFDRGADREGIAADLELVGLLQSVSWLELA